MQNENFFSIAELDIKICFAESPFNGMHLIPSLEPFREKNLKGELFFNSRLTIPFAPTQRKNANASEPLILEMETPSSINSTMADTSISSRTYKVPTAACC